MPTFPILVCDILILLLSLTPEIIFSFTLPDTPQFDRNLLLVGDAKPLAGASSVQLTAPNSPPSSGLLVQSKPFKLVTSGSNSKLTTPMSFSTDFTFSISPHSGDGLAFIIVPADFLPKFSRENFGLSQEKRYFGVEFDTLVNENVGDENANHVGVDVGSLVSLKVTNVSSLNLVLNSGIKLHSWVDYDSGSKKLDVRLSEFGSPRPYDPFLAYRIDLGEMWKEEDLLVGLSSSSEDSQQQTRVYSWKFGVSAVPKSLHSQPVDPRIYSVHGAEKMAHKKKGCIFWFLSRLIFATGCGMLVAFAVLFVWLMFSNNQLALIPVKGSVNSGDFRYEKIKVVVEESSADVEK